MYDRKQYRSDFEQSYGDARWTFWRVLPFVLGVVILLGALGWVFGMFSTAGDLAQKQLENSVTNYEEFQSIFNTCQKINTDMGAIKQVPDSDPMFSQFSKNAQLQAKRQQLTRWVEEYNAKSRMVNRAMWKSSSLPYQLSVNDFSNY
jgi:hypothetical protein